MRIKDLKKRRGVILVAVVICMIVVAAICGALLRLGLTERVQVEASQRKLQAVWLAESGLERAAARLAEAAGYAGETWEPSAGELGGPWGGSVSIVVERDPAHPSRRLVKVQADYPRDATARARQIKQAAVEIGSETSGDRQ